MQAIHRELGLTDGELDRIVALLEREPSPLELAMYAVMWSEHCSYKSSSVHLRRLPTGDTWNTPPTWVIIGPGEGAGVVDLGDGLVAALRIESHNHPSAVEPFQGAATGVGGIIRDVFSVGARPIALMDSLRFGSLDVARNRYLLDGVVAGISHYGNAVGVPTVGGELVVDPAYSENPLVNVLCVGVARREEIVLARATAPGQLAVLIGASTGRDGIGGASILASAGFDAATTSKRPSVQVGDPFEEKKLIEACLHLVRERMIVGMQDLGAAGLSCAASEIAAKAGLGMEIDVAAVRRREPEMTPMEVMTSESQERMLAVVEPQRLDEVLASCHRFEVDARVVGQVTSDNRFRVVDSAANDRPVLADVPASSLGDGPAYERPMVEPVERAARGLVDLRAGLRERASMTDLGVELLDQLRTPNIADKQWISRQYDHQLFANTVRGPGFDAAVVRIAGPEVDPARHPTVPTAIALSTDGNATYCLLDPRAGAALVVLEAARNVACAGARPLGLVNCLNFGNPEHPAVMWQFAQVIDGMADACTALGIPVLGGNVSFYNESGGADIPPTPVVGIIGVIEDLPDRPPAAAFVAGHDIVIVGPTTGELGGSELARRYGLGGLGALPVVDLQLAARVHQATAQLVRDRVVTGVHDCGDGGLGVALAEMAVAGDVGCDVDLRLVPGGSDLEPWITLFAEPPSRVVFSVVPSRVDEVLACAARYAVPAAVIGRADGTRIRFRSGVERPHIVDLAVSACARAHRGALEQVMSATG